MFCFLCITLICHTVKMPRSPDPSVRTALIEEAARLLAEDPQTLTTRRLAEAVGTSTMAVYTHFRGMNELRRAVRREGFERLAAQLEGVTASTDPVADVAAFGGAYMFTAVSNPHLYRFMFMEPFTGEHDDVGDSTFESLVTGIERAIQAGRFDKADAYALATQLWSSTHGVVALHLSGLLTLDEAVECMVDLGRNLFIGFGDDRVATERSIEAARERFPNVSELVRSSAAS